MDDRFNRIFELARAAELIEWDELPSGALTPDHLSVARARKFAELIVRECVRYFNEDYQRDFDTLWREDLTKGIKEHFGVEE